MQMLSEDDLNLQEMTEEELEKAWDLWFTIAQTTNDDDPPYTHGVFTSVTWEDLEGPEVPSVESDKTPVSGPGLGDDSEAKTNPR